MRYGISSKNNIGICIQMNERLLQRCYQRKINGRIPDCVAEEAIFSGSTPNTESPNRLKDEKVPSLLELI